MGSRSKPGLASASCVVASRQASKEAMGSGGIEGAIGSSYFFFRRSSS